MAIDRESLRAKNEQLLRMRAEMESGNAPMPTRTETETETPTANVDSATVEYSKRVAIAKQHGLPEVFAARLVGNSPDELHKDASRLANSGLFKPTN